MKNDKSTMKIISIHLGILLLASMAIFAYSNLQRGFVDSISVLLSFAFYLLIHTLTAIILGIVFAIKKNKNVSVANFISALLVLLIGFGLCYLFGSVPLIPIR